MALKPFRECKKIGCHNLTRETYCDEHKYLYAEDEKKRQQFYDRHIRDKRSTKHYQSKEHKLWSKEVQRRAKGLCQRCSTTDRPIIGTEADHIIPIRTDEGWNRRLDINNGQLLCHKCHMIKTDEDKKKYGL